MRMPKLAAYPSGVVSRPTDQGLRPSVTEVPEVGSTLPPSPVDPPTVGGTGALLPTLVGLSTTVGVFAEDFPPSPAAGAPLAGCGPAAGLLAAANSASVGAASSAPEWAGRFFRS